MKDTPRKIYNAKEKLNCAELLHKKRKTDALTFFNSYSKSAVPHKKNANHTE